MTFMRPETEQEETTDLQATNVVHLAAERARLKDGIHIELSPRRVRTYFGGKLIADSDRVLLVYESKRPPAYWFPIADVRMGYLQRVNPSDSSTDIIRWRLAV